MVVFGQGAVMTSAEMTVMAAATPFTDASSTWCSKGHFRYIHKKQRPPRTLQEACAYQGPMVVLGEGAVMTEAEITGMAAGTPFTVASSTWCMGRGARC